jgi:hypothetical protein
LVRIFRSLPTSERTSLLDFAEFLAARQPAEPEPAPEPVGLPRPPTETVIAAIRRLSQTYPMLERGAMLNETSALMSAHVLQGQDAARTIDALESLFARYYAELRTRRSGADQDPDRRPQAPL